MFEPFRAFQRRVLTRFKDWAKYSRLVREVLAVGSFSRSYLPSRRVGSLISAYQRTRFSGLKRTLARQINALFEEPNGIPERFVHERWGRFIGSGELTRSIILKNPSADGEKGVILLTAEYNWLKLLATGDLRRFDSEFTVLFSAGWSPLDYSLLGLALKKLTGPVYVEPGNFGEVAQIEALHPRIRCLPTLCSAWIHPGLFRPRPVAERKIDLLMVANWAPFKRHWHFFSALERMPPGLRVTLIGQPDGPFRLDRVEREARDFCRRKVEFVQNLPVERVYEYMGDSRALAIFSRQEGPCVVVTEAMFADTPVAMLADAHIGSRAYINPETGVLLDDRNMAKQLLALVRRGPELQPRRWATENVSCHVSIRKWNAFLRQRAAEEGRPWNRDLMPFCWKPYPVYLQPEDRAEVEPTYHQLRAEYPALFGPHFLASVLSLPLDRPGEPTR